MLRTKERTVAMNTSKEPLHSSPFWGAMEVVNPFLLKCTQNRSKRRVLWGCSSPLEADFRPPETLRAQRGQALAVLVEVNQRKGSQQPFVIFL